MARPGLRSHFTGSVPISMAVHFVAVLMFLIIPLTATIELPDPATVLPDYIRAAPMPPPPPAPRLARSATPTPSVTTNPDLPPASVPDAIRPEAEPSGIPVPDIGQPSGAGMPDGIGLATGVRPVVLTPPDPPRPPAQVRVADLPISPRKLVDVRPQYPEIARAARVEGTIIMEAVLDTSGRVTQLRLLRSVPMLDQAALDAVRQWRYTPSLYGGRPVSVLMTITVRFTLQ
jgi:protein TonB